MRARVNTLGSGAWLLFLLISLLFNMVLGVALIWLSIDRNDTAYSIHKMRGEVEAGHAHVAKLEVERDSLLSPYVLGRKAQELGMGMADPGQMRRLSPDGDMETPAPRRPSRGNAPAKPAEKRDAQPAAGDKNSPAKELKARPRE